MPLYTPPNSYTLDTVTFPQIRLGIQGPPGSGKTYAALTFPNPIVLDFDNNLGVHVGRKDVTVVPFFNPTYIWEVLKVSNEPFQKGNFPRNDNKRPANRRDALLKWLREHGNKLTTEQTLVLDSWTSVQNSFHEQQDMEPEYTNKNTINEYAPWQNKLRYSAEVCKLLEGLTCHVVVTFHEFCERDPKSGELIEKYRPLMQGKFVAEIAGHFTDFFRQVVVPQKKKNGDLVKISAPPSSSELYSLSCDREFFWQIRQDEECDPKCGMTKVGSWKYLPANFQSFVAYK